MPKRTVLSEKALCKRHGEGSVCQECPRGEVPPAPWARLINQRERMRREREVPDPDSF